jgi:hypothetical protein
MHLTMAVTHIEDRVRGVVEEKKEELKDIEMRKTGVT